MAQRTSRPSSTRETQDDGIAQQALSKLCKGWKCVSDQYMKAYERCPGTTVVSTGVVALIGGTYMASSIIRSYQRSKGPNAYQKPFTAPNEVTITPTGYEDQKSVKVHRLPEGRRDITEAAAVIAGWLARSNDPITRACAAKVRF